MKVLHLAAGNRWTGAAAPAFAEVEALRGEGVEAHYAFVGGYKLEEKLRSVPFAHPIIEREQNPLSFRRSVRAILRLHEKQGFEILHAHLTYDHWLALFAARGTAIRLARTFHSRRTIRSDPFTGLLLRRTEHRFVINEEFRELSPLLARRPLFTPPPLDQRLFHPQGENVRARYGIGEGHPVIAFIGKVAKGRGFEDALRTFALLRMRRPSARMLIIGHGEHRPALEALAAALEVGPAVIWAGYHEHDLPEHYRAADALLFTAAGSDEGHRAVLEAMGCGLAVASYPLAGMRALMGSFADRTIATASTPEALAELVHSQIDRSQLLGQELSRHSVRFAYAPAAQRLLTEYQRSQ